MHQPIGYIYEITCLVNGKTYIGLRHYSRDEGHDWLYYLGSGALIKSSVKKYGRESFSKRKLDEAYSEEELQRLEWEHIQAAKKIGKAEYNLFNGVGAGGDTFSRLTPEKLAMIKAKQSASMKRFRAANAEERSKRYRDPFLAFQAENQRLVCSTYERLKSVKAVATELKVSVKWIREILDTANVEVVSVNTLSKEDRARFASDYETIAATLLEKPMSNGYTSLEYHDMLLERIEEIMELRNTISRDELEKQLNASHQWLTMFFRAHKIPKKTDRVVDTSECRRCRIGREKLAQEDSSKQAS